MKPRVHRLTVYPRWYEALATGIKTYELRSTGNRDFQRGDILRITCIGEKHDPLWFEVSHVRPGDGSNGLMPGYAILSLHPAKDPADG
jgi:uncharacterized protein YqfB (UPF0267 family)